MRTQLEMLAKRGWECQALTGMALDIQQPVPPVERLQSWGLRQVTVINGMPLWGVVHEGVEHLSLQFEVDQRELVRAHEEYALFQTFCHQLRYWKPDVVYVYGGLLLERALLIEARQHKIPTAFYLANANYEVLDMFDAADAVFTPSQTLGDYYRNRLPVVPQTIGSFVRPLAVCSTRVAPDAITFINPAPEKGIAIVLEIARQCLHRLPQARFLIVESRGTRQSAAEQFGINWEQDFPNVEFLPHQSDIRTVYARTKILLFASLWFEAAARVLREGLLNGIPILASRRGGTEEMLGGGGSVFEVPQRCCDNYLSRPTAEEVEPWVERLCELMTNDETYAAACARAQAAGQRHSLDVLADGLDGMLRGLTKSCGETV
jgi:glycosyltransferase involved in cell wall biosynthesis